jgi:hypothetical protein
VSRTIEVVGPRLSGGPVRDFACKAWRGAGPHWCQSARPWRRPRACSGGARSVCGGKYRSPPNPLRASQTGVLGRPLQFQWPAHIDTPGPYAVCARGQSTCAVAVLDLCEQGPGRSPILLGRCASTWSEHAISPMQPLSCPTPGVRQQIGAFSLRRAPPAADRGGRQACALAQPVNNTLSLRHILRIVCFF